MFLAKISGKGQLTLPSEIRRKYNIGKASYVRIIQLEDGVKLVPVSQGGIASLKGVVKVDGEQDFEAIRKQVMEVKLEGQA
ncbi:AbrB/MazE/SpoVT family DNA-binding domain-containing protein [Sporolituus thermophilus]|uniref:Looped-hinge helix DNA binding domain-containing protein, AbrB family n=1 Tax=Sporolituus thermophilus DSM 23256 TaxID=1123285 RepID=A0A1G7NAF8_9FIRM|nr:AbrB/MazE/SpoVT family DNA-binding domain-containing protein [Sporolituus thermophilus]SDF71023.1 looped-hinge helix DNA binding domain-containing protein, AbrB family [Sporolituus thermophilus DSM 23256]